MDMIVAYSWCLGGIMQDSVPGANGDLVKDKIVNTGWGQIIAF